MNHSQKKKKKITDYYDDDPVLFINQMYSFGKYSESISKK